MLSTHVTAVLDRKAELKELLKTETDPEKIETLELNLMFVNEIIADWRD